MTETPNYTHAILDGTWTIVHDTAAHERALACARGCYQRALLRGEESLSGSTLRGKAAEYGAHYARSRHNLLDRLTAAGVAWWETRGAHGRRLLVIGGPAHDTVWRLDGDPRLLQEARQR